MKLRSIQQSPAISLVLASFTVLFQELVLIRWLPSSVRVLAYFPNLILLSAFLGLGIGCLRAGKASLAWTWPLALLCTVVIGRLLGKIAFTQETPSEHLWLLYADLGEHAPVFNGIRLPIVAMFALSAACFVWWGQLVAERLESFRARGNALHGYGWDLAGSLLGSAGFALACFTSTPPLVWFAVVLAAGLSLTVWRVRVLLPCLFVAPLILFAVRVGDRTLAYSPYYALELRSTAPDLQPGAVAILANGSVHQYALQVGRTMGGGPRLQKVRASYRLPYARLPHVPRRVLVLGAGTGNDVAVALAAGAETVDAVEIDPTIRALGAFHPDAPYSSPKVRTHVTDARSFLDGARDKYDLIVFGTLDSMTRLSALSSVRLDNFVYTVECLRAARAALAPGGAVALYFMVGTEYVHRHLLAMIAEAFDAPPVVLSGDFGGLFNTIFLAGPAFADTDRAAAAELQAAIAGAEAPNDDWPYLYLRERGVSPFYLSVIAALGLLAAAAIFAASPELRNGTAAGVDLEMFLMGLAFLLLESKSVTQMALVWGVTWLTSAVVFGAILLTALMATLLRARRRMPELLSISLLALFLLASYALPAHLLVTTAVLPRLAMSVLFVGTPIFFASILFASLFEERGSSAVAFGWNLLGAVGGGLLEFASMSVGIRTLHLFALAAYLCVALLRRRAVGSVASAGVAASGS